MLNKAFCILFFILPSLAFGQRNALSPIPDHIRLFFGERRMGINQLDKQAKNSDILNHLITDPGYYSQLGISLRKSLAQKHSVGVTVSVYSDLMPRNIQIDYFYALGKSYGVSAFFQKYELSLAPYQSYEFLENKKIDKISALNNRDFKLYTYGLAPYFAIGGRWVRLQARLMAGVTKNCGFSDKSTLSARNTFEPIEIVYSIPPKSFFFISPEATLSLIPWHFKRGGLGFFIKGSYLKAKWSMPYKRTIRSWDVTNESTVSINPEKHKLTQTSFYFGLTWEGK